MSIEFSPPTADEMPLVYDAWASSFRKSPWAGCVLNRDWDAVSRATIAELCDRSRIIVGTIGIDSGRRVVGYSVSEPGVLHWLYVKRDYRGMGYGRRLLAATTEGWGDRRYTHRTNASAKFLGPGWKHDPVPARVKR